MALLGYLDSVWKNYRIHCDCVPRAYHTSVLRSVHLYITVFLSLCIWVVMGTLWTLQSSQPGLSMYSDLPMSYGTAYYAISLGVNILLTVLIMFRLYMYRRRLLQASLPSEHGKHYVSLAALIIESAALYSVFALMFLISYAVQHPINQIFLGVASSTQVMFSS